MREIFSFGFFLGKWNFAIGAEIHLTSWLFGVRYAPADSAAIVQEREVTICLPTLSFSFMWIDDENMKKKATIYEAIEDEFPEGDED